MDNKNAVEKAVYVTDEYGPSELWDSEGFIGKFINTNNNLVKADDGIVRRSANIKNIWVMVLTDPKLISRADKFPGCGVRFKKVNDEPVFYSMTKLKTLDDPNQAGNPIAEKLKAENTKLEEEKNSLKQKSKRYGELYSKICKAGGEYIANADPALIEEFEKLEIDLEIQNEKTD